MSYTFSNDLISDLHKDAYGFRPSARFFADWDSYTNEEKQECWDLMIRDLQESQEEEARLEQLAVKEFDSQVNLHIALGAGDRETALRWMVQDEKFYNYQCVEHWVWNQGILFTNEGRALVKELMNIVKFEEYA